MSEASAILEGLQREKRRAGVVAAATVMLALSWLSWAAWDWWHAGSEDALSQAAAVHATADPPQAPANSQGPRTLTQASVAELDESVFRKRLWVAPPRPVEVAEVREPPVPPPPPFKLQLVGVRRSESDSPAALIYDPETLKVTALTSGATLGRYTLDTLDPDAGVVVLSDSQRPERPRHTLRLNTIGTPKTPLKIVASPKTTGGAP